MTSYHLPQMESRLEVRAAASTSVCAILSICASTDYLFMDGYILPKWLIGILSTGLSLFLVSLLGKKERFYLPRKMVLFGGTLLLLALSTVNEEGFINVLVRIFLLLSLYFILIVLNRDVDKYLKYGVVLGGLYTLCVGWGQFLNGSNSTTGTYDNNAGFSLTMSIMTIYLCSDMICNRTRVKTIVYSILIIAAVAILLLSGSRIGCLAICIGGFIIANSKYKIIIMFLGLLFFVILTFIKFDSTQGRSFIYRVSLSMLDSPDKLLLGRGTDGFRKDYMIYQAKALERGSERQQVLADNIKHPLNEVMLFGINYGLIRGICLLGIVTMFFYHSKCSLRVKALMAVILSFSMFSYPFTYPLTWIIMASIFAEMSRENDGHMVSVNPKIMSYALSIMCICALAYVCQQASWQRIWVKAHEVSCLGRTRKALDMYEQLSKGLFVQPEFHYNHAAVLLRAGRTEEALNVIESYRFVDYDSCLLKGDIYMREKAYIEALSHYKLASEMCPNRFVPLFAMYQIYEQTSDKKSKTMMGERILNKEIKVPSLEIEKIINYIKKNK